MSKFSDSLNPNCTEVIIGDPTNRPAGNPCFGCGRQVRTERRTPVCWPNDEMTSEAVCFRCSHRYQ